jgi:hypothetical protein
MALCGVKAARYWSSASRDLSELQKSSYCDLVILSLVWLPGCYNSEAVMASLWRRRTKTLTVYDKLPAPKSIRLLTILPGSFGNIIDCRLDMFELEKAPRYEALSYVWGSVGPPKRLSVTASPSMSGQILALLFKGFDIQN